MGGVMRANIAASAASGRVLSTSRVPPAKGKPGDAVVPEDSGERSRRAIESRKDRLRASDLIRQDGTGEARSVQSRGGRKLRMIAKSIRRTSGCRGLRRTTFRALRTRTDRPGKGDRDRIDSVGLLHEPIELCPQFAVGRKVSAATGEGRFGRKQAAREERE
jgi:hypothetical protein